MNRYKSFTNHTADPFEGDIEGKERCQVIAKKFFKDPLNENANRGTLNCLTNNHLRFQR